MLKFVQIGDGFRTNEKGENVKFVHVYSDNYCQHNSKTSCGVEVKKSDVSLEWLFADDVPAEYYFCPECLNHLQRVFRGVITVDIL